jgi:uncharacterized protein involved in exopolysaccharide biosynthesis
VERTLLTRGLEPAASGSSAKPTPVTERARLEAQRRELKNSLTDLQRRYTANHPEVKDAADRLARLDEQIKALPPDPPITADNSDNTAITVRLQLLDRESKRLSDEQKRITGQIVAYRTKVDAVPVREQQMAELNRNYSVSKEHYQSLLDKTFSAEMAADLERKQQAEHFTIVDKAQVPEKPFKPKRRLMLLGAVLASFCFSVALAYGKDMLNSSFKIERELRAVLPANVPVLASVPRLDCSADRRKAFRFAVLAVLFTVAGCTLEFMLYLRLHPIL